MLSGFYFFDVGLFAKLGVQGVGARVGDLRFHSCRRLKPMSPTLKRRTLKPSCSFGDKVSQNAVEVQGCELREVLGSPGCTPKP